MKTDTIASIATGMTQAGIGIIRVSGEEAIGIVDRVYRNAKGERSLLHAKSHTLHYGYIVKNKDQELQEHAREDWKKSILDEVLVAVMKAPHSYTMEDTVEINCHGGVLVMHKVLKEVLENGARLAEPGEFTKRAFLNGRIDLTKAEAVMDVIQSRNEWALSSSMEQLKGSVSRQIKELRSKLIYEIAFIESALDDPEHISLDGYPERLSGKLEEFLAEIKKLIDSADYGTKMKEGINTVIVGKPNVGKSSLLNLLLGKERAIVTEIAGTTRDVIQESIQLQGIGLNLMDTAGIRSTQDTVERIGVERARNLAKDADLLLYVVDASTPLDERDDDIFPLVKDRKSIILLNKSDLTSVVGEEEIYEKVKDKDVRIVRTSTLEHTGLEELESAIVDLFFQGKVSWNQEVTITNLRHKEALQEAYDSLRLVVQSIENGMPEDFYSIDLMGAYAALGRIIGEEVGEDLVNEIFSKFCMGK